MPAKAGKSDWEVTMALSNALGYPMTYTHPSEIMDEIASLTPSFSGVSYKKLEQLGSIQWPCNAAAPEGTPTMHIDTFVRGKGKFIPTQFIATSEKVTRHFPLILTTGRILSQYNVGAQTRRTDNVQWHSEDRLEIHPHDAEERGIQNGDHVSITSRAGQTALRATVTERVQPGVVYTTFHFPESGANVITTNNSDWATNCPEYKVTAVNVKRIPAGRSSEWQQQHQRFTDEQLKHVSMARESNPAAQERS
jgi:formate dehydrogenase major subunit